MLGPRTKGAPRQTIHQTLRVPRRDCLRRRLRNPPRTSNDHHLTQVTPRRLVSCSRTDGCCRVSLSATAPIDWPRAASVLPSSGLAARRAINREHLRGSQARRPSPHFEPHRRHPGLAAACAIGSSCVPVRRQQTSPTATPRAASDSSSPAPGRDDPPKAITPLAEPLTGN